MHVRNIDILLMQEPYNVKGKFIGFTGCTVVTGAKPGNRAMAGIVIRDPNLAVLKLSHLSDDFCTCIEVTGPFGKLYLASVYFKFSHDIERYLERTAQISRSLREHKLVISADANAKSSLWHSSVTDERGEKLEWTIVQEGLVALNQPGNPPIFRNHKGSSNVDVTMSNHATVGYIGNWRVHENWISSDHNTITFDFGAPYRGNSTTPHPRFNAKRADWSKFQTALAEITSNNTWSLRLDSGSTVEASAVKLQDALIRAAEKSLPRKKYHAKSVPWWTENLTSLKKRTYRMRRSFQVESDPAARESKRVEYLRIRREYSYEIQRAKRASWRDFVSEVGNENPWGAAYKICVKKIPPEKVLASAPVPSGAPLTWEETARTLLNSLVPDDLPDTLECHRQRRARSTIPPDAPDTAPFTDGEISRAIGSLRNGKAPGPDLIEVEMLKAAYPVLMSDFKALFNACLSHGCFPTPWKSGSIRALLKGPDRDESVPSSYRPICLLSVVGKGLEKLIRERLEPVLSHPQFASPRQFGFRKGKSTTDAILGVRDALGRSTTKYALAILFDISGAFDNVWWPSVLSRLTERNCPGNLFALISDYLSSRTVSLIGKQAQVGKAVTRGCPQGSILGPSLWNLIFDDLLNALTGGGFEAFAYADDLLILVSGDSRLELERKGQRATAIIEEWCESEKLSLSEGKSEMILLRGHLDAERPPSIKIRARQIRMVRTVRYLGVYFDEGLRIRTHVGKIRSKCAEKFNSLAAIARRNWGLRYGSLKALYRGLFLPIASYAAPAWSDLLNKTCSKQLLIAQRHALLRTTKAYGTISSEALLVIAGALPIDLYVRRAALKYKVQKGQLIPIPGTDALQGDAADAVEEQISVPLLREWQERWDDSPHGRDTYKFLPDVQLRTSMGWFFLDHYITQLVSGHGDFAAKLHSRGLAEKPDCRCGANSDTPRHTFFECHLLEAEREPLRAVCQSYGDREWPPAPSTLLNETTFPSVAGAIRKILQLKEGLARSDKKARLSDRVTHSRPAVREIPRTRELRPRYPANRATTCRATATPAIANRVTATRAHANRRPANRDPVHRTPATRTPAIPRP